MLKLFRQENSLMTDGSIAGHVIRFAIPLLIGNLLQQTYQLVDMLIVGQCIDDGGKSIAAVGMGTSFIFMMIGFFVGISTGAGIVTSNGFGAGKLSEVQKTIKLSVLLTAAVSVAVSMGSILVTDWMLTVTNTTEDIFELSSTYLKIYAIGFIPLLIYNMGTSILQALGNSTSPFYYLSSACVLNIILDYVFIGPFEWGVAGAAAATVIAQFMSMCLILRKIFSMQIVREKYEEDSGQRSAKQIVKSIIRYSIPLAVQQVTVNLSNLILQGNINLLGTSVIAGYGIFGKIDGFLLLPMMSFSVAMTTFTGQNYGAGRIDRIVSAKRIVGIISTGVTLALSILLMFIIRPVAMLFEDSPEIVNATVQLGITMFPFYCVLALMRVYTGMFNGIGKTFLGSFAMIMCLCVSRVVCITVIFPIIHSVDAISYSYIFSWILCLIVVLAEHRFIVKKLLEQKNCEKTLPDR